MDQQALHHVESVLKTEIVVARSTSFQPRPYQYISVFDVCRSLPFVEHSGNWRQGGPNVTETKNLPEVAKVVMVQSSVKPTLVQA